MRDSTCRGSIAPDLASVMRLRRPEARMVERRAVVIATLALALFGSPGCLGGPVQLYDGPPRPLEEVASLSNNSSGGIRLFAIGPDRAFGSQFLIEPGRHEVWMRVQMRETAGEAQYTVWSYCLYLLDAEMGVAYQAVSESAVTRETAAGKHLELAGVIQDDQERTVARSLFCQGSMPRRAE